MLITFQLSVRKSLDLVGEKMTSLLPDPSLIDLMVEDEKIPDPLVYMNRSSELSATLAEGII